MADLSDVLAALEQLVQTAVYPNGTSNPSVAGVTVTIEQGWPIRGKLDSALQSGNAHVSVFPTNKEKIVTKFERVYVANTKTDATITAVADEDLGTVTLGGTIAVPQAVMVIVNGVGYSYQVLITDSLDDVAQSLSDLIPGASSVGTVITIPGASTLVARISTPYSASEELSRQERIFMVTCWAPTPAIRATLEAAIDVYFKLQYRFPLNDGYYALMFPETDPGFIDQLEKSLIYRRDLHYRVQYATTLTQQCISVSDANAEIEIVSEIS